MWDRPYCQPYIGIEGWFPDLLESGGPLAYNPGFDVCPISQGGLWLPNNPFFAFSGLATSPTALMEGVG